MTPSRAHIHLARQTSVPHVEKPYAPSCDENKAPLLAVLQPLFKDARRLLEIGSGTGQHGVHFAAAMPHLIWQTSEVSANLWGIEAWLAEAAFPNLPPPLALDVLGAWPSGPFDAVFSANTAHIMPLSAVAALFRGVGQVLAPGGRFALYGPFNEDGHFTSDSNRRFDLWLKSQDPLMGVRDLDALCGFAAESGLRLADKIAMPVNNQTLVWERSTD
jgi:SAM-dependent methyltransferase